MACALATLTPVHADLADSPTPPRALGSGAPTAGPTAGSPPGSAFRSSSGPATMAIPGPTERLGTHPRHLEVNVNTVAISDLVRFAVRDSEIWADRDALAAMGLRAEAIPQAAWNQAYVQLNSLSGVLTAYDALRQRLDLRVPVDLLGRNTTHTVGTASRFLGEANDANAEPSNAADGPTEFAGTGFVLNYDAYLQHHDASARNTTLNAWSEWRYFRPEGVFSSTMLSRWSTQSSGASGAGGPAHLRLDSTWRREFVGKTTTLTLGDTVTSAPTWSRPVRMGGIRIGTDFGLQPYQTTGPVARFEGQAALPSFVDLYVDGMLQDQLRVLPGTFTIESALPVSGAGIANLVITDSTGQQRTIDVPIYGTAALLRKGLRDWSLEMGALRRAYGRESFSYASGMVGSGTWRQGMTDALTLEAHTQWGGGIRLFGAGAVQKLGTNAGIANASLSTSHSPEGVGRMATLGYQRIARPWNFSAQSSRATHVYRDLSALSGTSQMRASDRIFMGYSKGSWDMGAMLMRQQDREGREVNLSSISLGRQFGNRSRWTLGFMRSRSSSTQNHVSLTFSIPIDRSITFNAQAQRGSDGLTAGWQASKSAAQEESWSWRVAQSGLGGAGSQGVRRGGRSSHFGATRVSPIGQLSANVDHVAGVAGLPSSTALGASFSGSAVLMDGRVFASRFIDDAFALVSSAGLPGIPVRLENRPVGQTDEQGHLLVSRLNANQRNQLSIDILDLPYDVSASSTSRVAVPQRMGGANVVFSLQKVISARASIKDARGVPLAIGAAISVEPDAAAPSSSRDLMNVYPRIGHDGAVFIENPVPGATLKVHLADRSTCRVQIPVLPASTQGPVHLGTLVCS